MEMLNKYFTTTIRPELIYSDYKNIVANFFAEGVYSLPQKENQETKVCVTRDKGQGNTKFLVESCYERENYIGNATNICFEQGGKFFSVAQRTFATFDSCSGDLFGPLQTFSGFAVSEQGNAFSLDAGDSQIMYERCCNAIDMISAKTLVHTPEQLN